MLLHLTGSPLQVTRETFEELADLIGKLAEKLNKEAEEK